MTVNKSQICPICKKSWDRCKCDLENDLGVKIGNPDQVAWKKLKIDSQVQIARNKRDLEILALVVKHAEKREKEEA